MVLERVSKSVEPSGCGLRRRASSSRLAVKDAAPDGEGQRVTTAKPRRGLQPEDQIHCSACGELHTVSAQSGLDSTSIAAKSMLYVYCTKPLIGLYYVGSLDGQSNRGPIVDPPESLDDGRTRTGHTGKKPDEKGQL